MSAKKFQIVRVQKHHSKRSVTGAIMHNLRTIDTPNADAKKSHLNKIPKALNTVDKCKARYSQLLGDHKPRKGAIYGFEVLVTASPEKMAEMSTQEQSAYFKDAIDFLRDEFGKENIVSVVVHRDETTPHLQAVFIPMVEGKLSYKKLLGGHKSRLSKFQDDFHAKVAKKWGLDRGRRGSKADHQTIKEYYRQTRDLPKLKEQAEVLRAELAYNERKLSDLVQGMNDAEERAQERLRGVLSPIVESLVSVVDGIDQKLVRDMRAALDELDRIKPDLPGESVNRIEDAISKLDPVQRPKNRR